MGIFDDLIPAADWQQGPNGVPRVQMGNPAPPQDRHEYAMQFFMNRGYSPVQASGIVGGLRGETANLNTTQSHDGGIGYGIAGWNGDRLRNLFKTYGRDASSLDNQLDYVDRELRGPEAKAYQALQGAQSPEDAGNAMLLYFRPKDYNVRGAHPERAKYASDMLNTIASAIGPSSANAAEASQQKPGMFDDLVSGSATKNSGMFDDLIPMQSHKQEHPGRLNELARAITDIPHKIYEAGSSAASSINEAFNPNSDTNKARFEAERNRPFLDLSGEVSALGNVGAGIMGIPAMIAAPLTGAARSVIGHTFEAVAPQLTPDQLDQLRKSGVNLPDGDTVADTAMNALAAKGGLSQMYGPAVLPRSPPARPPIANGPLGVTLSQGQATRDLPAIQREQAALRGTSGPAAQARAQLFADQQAAEVAHARDVVSEGLDQFGQRIAQSPQQAAEIAQNSIQTAARQSKATVDAKYATARNLPGEIHAGVFEGLPQKIKGDLTLSPEPVIIDQGTPVASRMIDYLDQKIGQIKIPNRADPFGDPNSGNIVGVSLKGVEQWRKALSTLRGDALSSGNASDARAARAVLNAFDDHIDQAVNNGLFKGDPRAVQAWNDARAAHADYKRTFSAGNNDPVGRVVERMLGKGNNAASIPNDVADFIYGGSGVNPNSLNVQVAKRLRSILGEDSPEWSGVKQGLFSKLVETPEGVRDFGPGKIAERLNQFLNGNGKEMADTIFSPVERSLLRQYADLHRALEIPQSGANWSNTATFLAPMLKSISQRTGSIIGGAVSHIPIVGPVAGALVDNMGGAISNAKNAREIAQQMPLVVESATKFRNAMRAYNNSNSPPTRIALSVAAANLGRSLRQIGVEISLPGVSGAEGQQDVPRPPSQ